jgi:hypothetical protein
VLHGERGKGGKPSRRGGANRELQEFVQRRQTRNARRIRWRSFDRDGDGRLTAEDIDQLCAALRTHPDRVLVSSASEAEPTTHPRTRDRIFLLHAACTSASACRGGSA